MIKRVLQTRRHNCGSAVLAMVLGTTVEVIEERHLFRRPGELKDPHPPKDWKFSSVIGVTYFEDGRYTVGSEYTVCLRSGAFPRTNVLV